MPRGIVAVLLLASLLLLAALPGRAGETPDAALARLLAGARAAAAGGACTRPGGDRLVKIYCAGHIRIGVRDDYPLFAMRRDGRRQGYEIDLARAIAARLGVRPVLVEVTPATRVAMVAGGEVDLVIATMGDNTQRETQLRFIRPHYYRSETVVVGPRNLAIASWKDIRGRTVCVTVGNGSNAELVGHGVRLMLFDDAASLPKRLADETCMLAAQDDSFFASYFTDPHFAARFSAKFGFARVPWGMAVAKHGSAHLARALDLLSQLFHRDGVFLAAARAHHIATTFLTRQQEVWASPRCNAASGSSNPLCVLPPANVALQPTPFAAQVTAFKRWLAAATGIELSLPMLQTAPAWSLFLSGVANSLVLIGGALAATLAVTLMSGVAMGSRSRLLRWPVRAATIVLQSSPILLTLVIAAALARAVVPYSSAVSLGAAIVALGLVNGSNAGQALAEACHSVRLERAGLPLGPVALLSHALSRSATQIVAFLINAAKGTPIASFIGAPELLSALTDITSFSSGRATAYTLLLVFYTAVVVAVVWLCRRLQWFLEHSRAAA